MQNSAPKENLPPKELSPVSSGDSFFKRLLRQISFSKIGTFILSLFLFILAITLMKDGAKVLGPLVKDSFNITNPANSLGFGWLFAYGVMSGSPVAAVSLAFFDAGILDALSSFTMITGSRFGANFLVLFIGFIYILRGRNRVTSLGMGLLSFCVTVTTYTAALFIGLFTLQQNLFANLPQPQGGILQGITDLLFDPISSWIGQTLTSLLPGSWGQWLLFAIGLGLIMLSFSLFDKCLPEMSLKESQVGRVSRLVYRPWVMFVLGCLVTMVSMSVSVSLSLLVPLSARGFVRRENVIPYIMGANITTFIDTLLAAVLLDNPLSYTIVLAHMVSVTIVSTVILALFYSSYERTMLHTVNLITENNRNLAIFMAFLFVIPLILMFL